MYHQLKKSTKEMKNLSFILRQLEKEFRESLEAANHQKNKSVSQESQGVKSTRFDTVLKS